MENIKNNLVVAWSQVHGHLEKALPGHAIHAWFEPIIPVNFRENSFFLEVPNQFFLEWIESHYKDDIIKAIKIIYGEKIKYKFLVSKEKSQKNEESAFQDLAVQAKPKRFNNLNLKYTFENFIVGSNNEFAKTASESVSNNPGEQNFNPLIIYGGVGLGKTHLMHAVAWNIKKRNPKKNVVYLTAEKFMYQFIKALRFKNIMSFKEQFRSVDVLMIDDVQFIIGKDNTQEEFFHTFNTLIDKKRQIIISADKSPADLDGLEDRLKSRLGWGLVADIHPLTYELRLGILQAKAEQKSIKLKQEVIEFLANKITNNVREMEGALNRLAVHASIQDSEISVDLVKDVLKDLLRTNSRKITIDEIQKKVVEHYNIKLSDMHSPRRSRSVARPRQVAMYLAKSITTRSLPEIGRKFGGRDHTTVMHAVKKIEELKLSDVNFNEDLELLKRLIDS